MTICFQLAGSCLSLVSPLLVKGVWPEVENPTNVWSLHFHFHNDRRLSYNTLKGLRRIGNFCVIGASRQIKLSPKSPVKWDKFSPCINFHFGTEVFFKGDSSPEQLQSVPAIWSRKTSTSFPIKNGWTEIEGSTHDKSMKNLLCWNVHEKTNHSVLAHLWCVMERSWSSQLAKYLTQSI